MNTALRNAFPGMPDDVLRLLDHGDLSAALPDWLSRFESAFEDAAPGYGRVERAWRAVLAAYDEMVSGEGVEA